MTAEDFVRLHGAKSFRHSEDLFSAIASGEWSLISGPGRGASCRELLNTYKYRVKHLSRFRTPHAISIREDCEALCCELENVPEELFRGWIFQSAERSFSVFEEVKTSKILGCIGGVDRRKVDEGTWDELWGEKSA